jgi:hypothetical protein
MYRLRPEYLLNPLLAPHITTSFCDTSPLRATLERVVNTNQLSSGKQVVITAVDIASGELKCFGNTESLQNNNGKFANTDGLTLDHIIASSSLPHGFPMTQIGGHWYWDGGLRSNTPLSEAINCLEAIQPNNSSVEREVIVIELIPMAGQVPKTIQEVTERILGLMFSSKLALDQRLFQKVNGNIELFEAVRALLDAIQNDQSALQAVDSALNRAGAKLNVDQIRNLPAYIELNKHRRIDKFTVIPFVIRAEYSQATDFAKASIEQRIKAGYEQAVKQRI